MELQACGEKQKLPWLAVGRWDDQPGREKKGRGNGGLYIIVLGVDRFRDRDGAFMSLSVSVLLSGSKDGLSFFTGPGELARASDPSLISL